MKRVLVVNNHLGHRGTLLLSLKEGGFDCVEAENETTTLSLLAARSFDLVIIDLAPPVIEGLHLLHVIHKRALLKTTKAIFITCSLSEEALNLAKEVQTDPYPIVSRRKKNETCSSGE